MEYLKTYQSEAKSISESEYKWYTLSDIPDMMYGIPNFFCSASFDKLPLAIKREAEKLDSGKHTKDILDTYTAYRYCTSGCMIRFKTTASRVALKIELKRKWDFQKVNLYNTSGFDIYSYYPEEKKYKHVTVVAPKTGENCFLECVSIFLNADTVIYFPTYNEILNFKIGILKGETLTAAREPSNANPIAFYGNSITQGASATRSGNIFCNIVSRQLDSEIYNYSLSGGAVGFVSIAKAIGKLNISALVIDYSQNAYTSLYLKETYEKFYTVIRKHHPNIPIILMMTCNFACLRGYDAYDAVIKNIFITAKQNGDNTFLLSQMHLFNKEDYDLCAVDSGHLTDYAMYHIADEISNILSSTLGIEKLF